MENFNIDSFLAATHPVQAFELFSVVDTATVAKANLGLPPEDESPATLNLCDAMWLLLAMEMRALGLAPEVIDEVGEALLEPVPLAGAEALVRADPSVIEELPCPASDREAASGHFAGDTALVSDGAVITPLEAAIIQCLRLNSPTSLRIFPASGEVIIWVDGLAGLYDEADKAQVQGQSHFNICFSGILRRFLTGAGPAFASDPVGHLEPDAMQVMEVITSGKYDRVDITYKGGRMKSMDLTRSHRRTANVPQIIAASDFQEVTVKRHRGKTTYIQTTEKIYFR